MPSQASSFYLSSSSLSSRLSISHGTSLSYKFRTQLFATDGIVRTVFYSIGNRFLNICYCSAQLYILNFCHLHLTKKNKANFSINKKESLFGQCQCKFDRYWCFTLCQKCDMAEAGKYANGKPSIPILNEQTLPKFLESARMEKTVNRNGSKLKLFSGTANPALSQVTCHSLYET